MKVKSVVYVGYSVYPTEAIMALSIEYTIKTNYSFYRNTNLFRENISALLATVHTVGPHYRLCILATVYTVGPHYRHCTLATVYTVEPHYRHNAFFGQVCLQQC